jgi:Rrf2 family protein
MATSKFSMAVHTLALLARYEEKPVNSEFLACSIKTNAVVIRRLLSELARSNFVVSQTGANGGTRLARAPEKICLLGVYRAVENGQVFALPRNAPDKKCDIGRNIEAVLCEIQNCLDAAIEDALGKMTLADIVRKIEKYKAGEKKVKTKNKVEDCLE